MKNTKRSLLTSLAALLLCFVMLIGTTFAWFTDEATSANNIIKAGNLDIGMKWSKDNANWKDTEGAFAEPVFDYDKWEPGYTEVRYIKVTNDGTLAFKYQLFLNPTGTVGKLAEVIDVSYDIVTGNPDFEAPATRYDMGSLEKVGTLNTLIASDDAIAGGVLLPKDITDANYYTGEIVICVAFHMQELAGNEYQESSIGDAFGINLYATQFDYENDSYDNSYDDGAEWPDRPINSSASATIDSNNITLGALSNEVTITAGNGISATLPADVKLVDGATSLDLTVKSTDADGNLTLGDGDSAKGFDVHISGIAADNTKPMIVNLGAILPTNLSDTELKLYHTENGTPVLMTRVGSAADFAVDNQYTYDPATGKVSIYVDSFSVFTAVKTSADEWDGTSVADGFASGTGTEADPYVIKTAAQLVYFRNQVDAGVTYADQFVKLASDIDLADHLFDPIGYNYEHLGGQVFKGTFDGGNYTIYNLYQNGWDLDTDKTNYSTYTYSTAGGGLFASIKDATIKNLAVSDADIKFECVDIGIVVGYAQGNCHFENIVVTDSVIANYNRATGAVVGEVCFGEYGTNVENGYSHTFNNITVDSNVVVSSLWGSFDTLCGGVIGGKWGDATVKMTNVNVAAELDVYSDVTAAYQWYAYRRCGMLIGYTEQESPKKGGQAAAPFLTCDNVNVYYGDWVNYTYYEFENQYNDTGKRYPWVRAEESPVGNNGAFSNPRYGVPVHGGLKVTEDPNMETLKTDYTTITFNQLYGGGQGIYGTNDHEGKGVTIHKISEAITTVKFQNNGNWENLKIEYWFAHGENKWSTLVEGLSATSSTSDGTYDVYTFNIPNFAYSFKITGTKSGAAVSTNEFMVSELEDEEIYALDGTSLTKTTKIVFTPNTAWVNGGGRFAVYAFGSGEDWYNLISDGKNYVCYLPANYTKVIFCRMNSNHLDNRWNIEGEAEKDKRVWSQTGNNVIPDSDITDGEYSYTVGKYIYFRPSEGWKSDNARFAAYFFGNGEKWVSLTDADGDGIYEVEVPSGYSKVIFCRMNGSSSTNNWDNRWNQTGNLSFTGSDYEIFYAVPEDNQWNNPTTGWYGLP